MKVFTILSAIVFAAFVVAAPVEEANEPADQTEPKV